MSKNASRNAMLYHSKFDDYYSHNLKEQLFRKEIAEYGYQRDLVNEKLTSIHRKGNLGTLFVRLWEQFFLVNKAEYDLHYIARCDNLFSSLMEKLGSKYANVVSQEVVSIYNTQQSDFLTCLESSNHKLLKKMYLNELNV